MRFKQDTHMLGLNTLDVVAKRGREEWRKRRNITRGGIQIHFTWRYPIGGFLEESVGEDRE